MLEVTVEQFNVISYRDLEEWIDYYLAIENFSVVADFEAKNDSDIVLYKVDGQETEGSSLTILHLHTLVRKKILPEGNYIINIMW